MPIPDREKAVALAKDVLAHLHGLTTRTNNAYLNGYIDERIDEADSAQEHINEIVDNCDVCAIGALALSYIRIYNNVKISDLMTDPGHIDAGRVELINYLKEAFYHENIIQIERSFESGYGLKQQPDIHISKERLEEIANNIIDNDGVFVPYKAPTVDNYKISCQTESSDRAG